MSKKQSATNKKIVPIAVMGTFTIASAAAAATGTGINITDKLELTDKAPTASEVSSAKNNTTNTENKSEKSTVIKNKNTIPADSLASKVPNNVDRKTPQKTASTTPENNIVSFEDAPEIKELDNPTQTQEVKEYNPSSPINETPDTTIPQNITLHTVEPGETFSSIAKKYDLSIDQLLKFNPNISNIDTIMAGQVLRTIPEDKIETPQEIPDTVEIMDETINPPAPEVPTIDEAPRENTETEQKPTDNSQDSIFKQNELFTLIIENTDNNFEDNKRIIIETAQSVGLDSILALAIAEVESSFESNAKNPYSTATGLMQLIDSTALEVITNMDQNLRESLPLHKGKPGTYNVKDARVGAALGVTYLKTLSNLNNNDQDRTIASYFQGPGSVRVNGITEGGREYVNKVLAAKTKFI